MHKSEGMRPRFLCQCAGKKKSESPLLLTRRLHFERTYGPFALVSFGRTRKQYLEKWGPIGIDRGFFCASRV